MKRFLWQARRFIQNALAVIVVVLIVAAILAGMIAVGFYRWKKFMFFINQ